MGNSQLLRLTRRTSVSVLIAGMLSVALACGTASESAGEAPSRRVDSISIAPTTAAGTSPQLDAAKVEPSLEVMAAPQVEPAIGPNVGNRAPEFTLLMADGTTVKSADLLAAKRPTFLYFFTTW